jgi:hypothetical protein
MSRYISLQTFDADHPISGKLLLMKRNKDDCMWYNKSDAYEINEDIGYDINFNKFKNHGIELRFFDWFPEMYLEAVMNFLILLAERAMAIDVVFDKMHYQDIILGCVRGGFHYVLSMKECNVILRDLQLTEIGCGMTAHTLLQYISDILYEMYRGGPIATCMSPRMRRPELVNYNKMAYEQLCVDLFGKK